MAAIVKTTIGGSGQRAINVTGSGLVATLLGS